MTWIIVILLIVLLVGGLPTWPYSAQWGYGPSGLLFAVLVVILVVMLLRGGLN